MTCNTTRPAWTPHVDGVHACTRIPGHPHSHRCPCGLIWNNDAAPRPALDSERGDRLPEAAKRLEAVGIDVGVGDLTPTGRAVLLVVHDRAIYLNPAEAVDLGDLLKRSAMDVIHAERSDRRG